MLAKWNAVLAAAGRFLWDGSRDDAAIAMQGTDGNLVRKYVWLLKDEALIFVVNLTQADKAVRVEATGFASTAHHLLGGRPLDLSQSLTAPALDAAMVVVSRRAQAQ